MKVFLTVAAVAEELDVSIRTVQRYVERGDIQAVRLPGGRLRIRQDDFEAAVASWQTRPAGRMVGGVADETQAA